MAITNEGESQSFGYTGGMQTFTVAQKGVYKLEVWGARGGGDGGGKGGYAYGHALLDKGAVLHICCGQAGAKESTAATYNGGGGGAARYFDFTPSYKPTAVGSSGGGATHIATRSGTLAQLGSVSGLLLVAGGGGGCPRKLADRYGGVGGGETGGTGRTSDWSFAGGTQSGGHAFGQGQTATGAWGDYEGNANYDCAAGSGGGGGLYGGYADVDAGNHAPSAQSGAGGGSGYVGGVPMLTYFGTYYRNGMSSGQSDGAGMAKITLVKKGELPVVFNGTALQRILFNGVEVGSLIYNGTRLFMERIRGWKKRGISVFRNDDRWPAW